MPADSTPAMRRFSTVTDSGAPGAPGNPGNLAPGNATATLSPTPMLGAAHTMLSGPGDAGDEPRPTSTAHRFNFGRPGTLSMAAMRPTTTRLPRAGPAAVTAATSKPPMVRASANARRPAGPAAGRTHSRSQAWLINMTVT